MGLTDLGETFAGLRVDAVQGRFEVCLRDGAVKGEAFGAPPVPFSVCFRFGLTLAGIVFVLGHVLEITDGGAHRFPGGDGGDHQFMLSGFGLRMRAMTSAESRPAFCGRWIGEAGRTGDGLGSAVLWSGRVQSAGTFAGR